MTAVPPSGQKHFTQRDYVRTGPMTLLMMTIMMLRSTCARVCSDPNYDVITYRTNDPNYDVAVAPATAGRCSKRSDIREAEDG